MKRVGFIRAAFLLFIMGFASGIGMANAQVAVTDPITEANTLQAVVRDAEAAAKRIEVINNQIAQLIQIKNTVAAVSHGNLAALSTLVPERGALGFTLPLGQDTSSLVHALSGTAADLGATATLTRDLLRTDQFYAPTASDFRAVMLNQMAVSAAAAKAAAETALNANTQRLTSLNTLRNGLGSTPDVKAAADAGARLAGEQATAQAQGNQLLALLLMQNARAATTQAQEQQMWRCSADNLVAGARAAAAAAASGTVTLISGGAPVNCGPLTTTTSSGTTQAATADATNSAGTLLSGSGMASQVSGDGTALATMLGT